MDGRGWSKTRVCHFLSIMESKLYCSQDSASFLCFQHNVYVKFKVTLHGHTEILDLFSPLDRCTPKLIGWKACLATNWYSMAFTFIKRHLPLLGPVIYCIDIDLEVCSICFWVYSLVQQSVVCIKTDTTIDTTW